MDASEPDNTNAPDSTMGVRTLFIMRAGARLFAVHAEEVEATEANLTPTPLPSAPPAVRGVVSLRGRVRTVLDLRRLFDADQDAAASPANTRDATSAPASQSHVHQTSESQASNESQASDQTLDSQVSDQNSARLFVALRGDEQLALVCDAAEEALEVVPARIAPSDDASPARGTFLHRGRAVTLLDPARLFDAAMRGTDRRRRRS
jgi:chemotaxis signal transduction protein